MIPTGTVVLAFWRWPVRTHAPHEVRTRSRLIGDPFSWPGRSTIRRLPLAGILQKRASILAMIRSAIHASVWAGSRAWIVASPSSSHCRVIADLR